MIMPVVETRIQHEYVMKFLCRREEEGGLGYRQTDPPICLSLPSWQNLSKRPIRLYGVR